MRCKSEQVVQSKLCKQALRPLSNSQTRVMTDFGSNHFNVFVARRRPTDTITTHVIRPMLESLKICCAPEDRYALLLDNWLSVGPIRRARGCAGSAERGFVP